MLTFTAPERVEGLTFVSSQTGIKLQCEGLSTEPAVLPGPAGGRAGGVVRGFPAGIAASDGDRADGELPDGTAFSLKRTRRARCCR